MTSKRIEDALKKCTMEYNILNDDLKREQAQFAESDKLRKFYETQAKELVVSLF